MSPARDGQTDGDDAAGPVDEPSYRPPVIAAGASVGAALLATVTVATASIVAFGAAGLGTWTVIVGLVLGWGILVSLGAALVFGAVVLAGLLGTAPLAVLVGAIATALVYDAGNYAVRLGTQLRQGATTGRAELAHVGATAVVASGAGVGGYLVFELGSGGQPSTALIALLLAAVLLVWGLQSS